jgi:hypothetical protein
MVEDGQRADHQIMQIMAADCRHQAEVASDPARCAQLLEVAKPLRASSRCDEVMGARKTAQAWPRRDGAPPAYQSKLRRRFDGMGAAERLASWRVSL